MKFLIPFLISITFSMEADKLYNLCANGDRVSMPVTISACVAYIEGAYDASVDGEIFCLRKWSKIKWRNKYLEYRAMYPHIKKASKIVHKILQFEHLCLDLNEFDGFELK